MNIVSKKFFKSLDLKTHTRDVLRTPTKKNRMEWDPGIVVAYDNLEKLQLGIVGSLACVGQDVTGAKSRKRLFLPKIRPKFLLNFSPNRHFAWLVQGLY